MPQNDFWKHQSFAELVAEQGVKPYDPAAWKGAPEITDEELEWWLVELRRLRREGSDMETPA
jgi:hypothetical protein